MHNYNCKGVLPFRTLLTEKEVLILNLYRINFQNKPWILSKEATNFYFLNFILFFMVLGIKPRAFHVLGKWSTTNNLFVVSNNSFENIWSLVVYLEDAYIAYQGTAFRENHLFEFLYLVIQWSRSPPHFFKQTFIGWSLCCEISRPLLSDIHS